MVTRRDFIKAGAASGALLLGRPWGALASSLGPTAEFSTSRASRLFLGSTLRLAHADLHNHTLYSDGDGDPAKAFSSMRDAGLDIAALTDHATVGKGLPQSACFGQKDCQGFMGIDEETWAECAALANLADDEDNFTAIRGFEWSSPTLGHMNVWFSSTWTDPLHTGGATAGEGIGQFTHETLGIPRETAEQLDGLVRQVPTSGVAMQVFYDWLAAPAGRPIVGGGSDAIAGFNHPGREVGRFGYFAFKPEMAQRIVIVEVFNRNEDYLFEGTNNGVQSPINDCLNKGWRVGLLGVTDEHGTDWGYPDGKGRTGLWVHQLTRAGVREAMEARRFFSTRLRGLRLDATAASAQSGATAQMGGHLPHQSGPITFQMDIDRGPEWYGKALRVQVLTGGSFLPRVLSVHDVVVPTDAEPVISFTTTVDVAEAPWLFLRVTDPSQPADSRATGEWSALGNAVAYASPFFLDPRYGDSVASQQKRATIERTVAAAIPFQHPPEHTHAHGQASHHGHHHGTHSHTH